VGIVLEASDERFGGEVAIRKFPNIGKKRFEKFVRQLRVHRQPPFAEMVRHFFELTILQVINRLNFFVQLRDVVLAEEFLLCGKRVERELAVQIERNLFLKRFNLRDFPL